MRQKLLLTVCFTVLIATHAFSSCSAPQNAIEAENCNTGSNSWAVNNPDSTIQGFTTDISYNIGDTVNFKISTPATSYHISILRMGYYQGNGARLITTISPSAKLPQTQPACLTNAATNLVDCGNWAISASWTIPTTAVSGIYFADIVRGDTGGANQIFFVVRNDSSHSDVLFQTADESWEAYNGYGGHSLYGSNAFDLTNRAYKVSYNRPFAWIETETQPFYAEYPMVRWLEANGYDVSYTSSVDSARSGALIKNHKLFLSVGHDEYVSGPKRANVEAARDSGVNMAFFSGNEFFWKTRWENSIDGTDTPYRTLVCYKETLGPTSNPPATAAADPMDPPTWTGTWRDPSKSPPADGGRPENALTGQLFRVNGPGSDNSNLSIKVPAGMGKLRFWRNTPNVSTQSAGATWTLPAGTLGYEWDAEEDNGSRPAGLFDLSSATYNLTTDYLQDAGGLYGTGTATHKLSLYRAPSGALVFGAGTVQWSWGLDAVSGGAEDTNMEQATVNLFADMGVQPVTLQSGLIAASKSTDTTAPTSTITAPSNGSSVQAGTTISVTGTASDVAGLVAGVEVSVDSGATWHPATGTTSWSYSWQANTGGTFTVMSRAVDDTANLETPSTGVSVNIIGVVSVSANPSIVSGGGSSQGTVTLSAPAPTGGTTVTLTSSAPSAVLVPASVLVPAGSTTANFTITTNGVGASAQVTLTAKFASTATTTLTVNPVFPPPAGVIDIDALVSAHQATSSTTMKSAPFSTAAGSELILALISSDSLQSGITVTGVSGGGLTWSLVQRTNAQNGTAEIWRAFATSVLSNVTATATFSQTSPSAAITIMSFTGVDTTGSGSGAIGASASGSGAFAAPTASLTTTRNNSWVIGVGADNSNAIARTVGSNQVLLDSYLSPLGDTFWSQRQNVLVASSGTSVTINDTAPTNDSYNLAIVEVRAPVVGAFSISGNLSATGSGATVALTGAMTQTVTADASGNYSFSSLTSGSYTVTPTKTGFLFTPASQAVTISSSSIANVNFSAAQTFSISGTITPATSGSGATVTLSGSASATTTADASGNYSFSGVVNGNYTVTPSKQAFTFSPASQSVTVSGANVGSLNFTATQQGFSISGNLSANGAGATVALTGAASASTTADASGNYSFAGLANGTYTITPTKSGFTFTPASQNATISGSNVAGLNFTAQGIVTTNLTIDVNTSKDGTSASSSIASSPFTTASGNELLLAFIATDYLGGASTTVTNVTGGGLTWAPVVRANAQSGDAEVWRALTSAPLANTAVTATLSQSVVSSITIISFTGVDLTGTSGSGAIGATASKSASTGAPSVSIVTTRNNSWVFGVGNDFDNAVARTPSSGQSVVHQDLTSAGDTYWVQMQNATSALSGSTVAISDTAPTSDRWNLVAVEVLPSLGSFNISGTVTPAITGATIALSGTVNATATPDGSGNYLFSGLPNGSYTVTPSKAGFNFSPASQNVTVNGASVNAVNFTAAAQTFSISGSVSATGANATLTLSGSATGSTTADASGNYTFTGLLNGTYTVTPSKPGVTFTPTSQNVTVNGSDVSAVNFTGAQIFNISGSVSATGANATLTLSGSATGSTTADASGNYTFTGLLNGTYTVTPAKPGVTFTPLSQTVTVSGSNVSAVNFTAEQIFNLSGSLSVTGANASVALSGSATGSTTADASGNYTFTGLLNGTYTVTPSKSAVTFNPTSQSVTVNGANVSGVNFTATGQTFTISGTVSATGANATVALSGSATESAIADGSGNYTFTGLLNGTYTVTPSKSGVTFNPLSQNVTLNGSNVSGVNFTAAQVFTISGSVSATGANATVTLSGSSSGSTSADASGNYTFTGLLNGTYAVTPSKSGVTFNPTSQSVTVNGSNVSGVNFTATVQTFSISGSLSATGANATVALSGSATGSTTADVSGNYAFNALSNGTYTITPSKSGVTFNPMSQNVTVNGSNVSGVNFTGSIVTAGLAIDANVSKDGTTASTTIATPVFTTKSGNELLLAFVAADYLSGTNTTVSNVSGASLTWALVKRTNTQSGDAEIWAAFAPSALTNATVTATVSQSVVTSLTVLSFTGVDTTMGTTLPNALGATGTANARPGAPTASLVTTRNTSWVFGVGNDYDNAIAHTPGAGQTLVHQFLTPTGDTYWVQMQSATTPTSGTTVTINDTAPATDRYNLTIVEVRTP